MGVSRVVCAVIVTVVLFAVSASGAVTNPGCRVDLASKVRKFETANLLCKGYGFPISNPYTIWALRDNVTLTTTMVVSMPLAPNGWAGIGFSADGFMPNSTALVATLSPNGTPIIKVYSLTERSKAGVVENATQLVFVGGPPEGYYDQGRTVYVSFQVDFNKSAVKPNFFLMAYGPLYTDGSLDIHVASTQYTATFVSGVVVGESAASKLERKSNVHGSLQIGGWAVLLPLGAITARYMRNFEPQWFYVHIVCQILGFTFIVGGIVTGFQLAKDLRPMHFHAHRALGLFLFFLVFLQVLAVVWRPKKDAKIRQHWALYHGGVGWLALSLATVNILLGLSIGNADWGLKVGYYAVLATVVLAVVILEVSQWVRTKRQQPKAAGAVDQDNRAPAFQFGGSV